MCKIVFCASSEGYRGHHRHPISLSLLIYCVTIFSFIFNLKSDFFLAKYIFKHKNSKKCCTNISKTKLNWARLKMKLVVAKLWHFYHFFYHACFYAAGVGFSIQCKFRTECQWQMAKVNENKKNLILLHVVNIVLSN